MSGISDELDEVAGGTDIAVVGMACRLPGAQTPSEFWELLAAGREASTRLGDDDLRAAGVPDVLLRDPNYVKAGMFLAHMEQFDPGFFGFSPLDGRILDPQHRHFLECTWEALENAGYDPTRTDASIGVFAGSGHNAYLPYNLLTNPQLVAEVGFFLLRHTGNDKDFLATRASYCFDLKGPSVNVQTACSTSLVAIHYASQSLINGECDMALAGGVTIEMPHHQGYLYKEQEILSRDGHCRPFDASAGGTLFGSGVGVVLLRRLGDAIAAGDHIHAVIKASAINNDGANKVSYLAPSVDGQAAAIHEALAIGDIDPRSVTYIEAHGTGTQLGDPIEVAALTQAYGADNAARQYCGLGSVKSNIGHLDTAAGIASLIKVILAMQHRQLPATLHYTAPNPAIDFSASPFYVNDRLRDWAAPAPLRAGVSSLGVGGTNAHLIIEEAPQLAQSEAPQRSLQLIMLSARSDQSLLRSRDRLAQFLENEPTDSAARFADLAYTLAVGRRGFRKRGFAVVADAAEAMAVLNGSSRDQWRQADAPAGSREAAFMFAGGGAQYPNMGRGLYESEPVYRAAIDECLRLLRSVIDYDLKTLLYPEAADLERAAVELERPSRTLPALFVTQYAQARLWESWGVRPAALIGHSMGENTAACIAGVLSLRDALGLVALRGKLFETVGEGSMLSVDLDEKELLPLLGTELSLAAINAPGLAVASGPKPALRALERTLAEREIGCKPIRIDVAAHSSMLDAILKPFGDYLRSISLQAPQIPFVSNLTGDWIKSGEATNPEYWVRHLRQTVRFAEGVGRLLESGKYALIEVGPGRTLSSLAGLHAARKPDQAIVTSLRHPDDATPDPVHMLSTLGSLWQAGVEIDWSVFHGDGTRRRVPLPTYAFDHMRCWVDPGTRMLSAAPLGKDDAERGAGMVDWLYQPTWQRAAPLAAPELRGTRVLLLAGEHALAGQLIQALQSAGADLKIVRQGARAELDPGAALTIRPGQADDFVRLVAALQASDWVPGCIIHTLALDVEAGADAALDPVQRARSFDSLFHLGQAAANEDWQALRWLVVTSQAIEVAGERAMRPLAALAQGPVRVMPHEFPGWNCRLVDIDDSTSAGTILAELSDASSTPLIAIRGRGRHLQRFLRRADSSADAVAALAPRAGAAYLITGGTGGLGLVAARAMAQRERVKLVLLARRPLPARDYWDQLITEQAPEADTLAAIKAIETTGSEVILETGDVADRAAMNALAARLAGRGAAVRGVIHTAGVVEDALLMTKDFDQAERVLAAKVAGTVVLDQVFAGATLDFFILYSSTSAFAGLPGQIDYAAANAFLDSYAHARTAEGGNFVAINWPAWRDVGMAAAIATGAKARRLPAGRPVSHPLIDRCIEDSPGRAVYATLFDVPGFWLLNEHRIKDGPALIPGAGFLELARAAFADRFADATAFTIDEAEFELPFIVGDAEHKLLRVALNGERDNVEFTLLSESFGDAVEHVRGRIRSSEPLRATLDIAAVRARCQSGEQRFDDADHHPYLDFGPRWASLRRVLIGEQEALVEIELDQEHQGELGQFILHPALLDMATAGAQVVIDNYSPQEEFYVPIGYHELRSNGAFARRSFSHVRFRPADASGRSHEVATLDIDVANESGEIFLQVRGFALRRLADTHALKQAAGENAPSEHPSLARTLELGVAPDDGADALMHVMAHRLGPQTVVSPYRLDYLRGELLRMAIPERPSEKSQHDADADPSIAQIEATLGECPAVAEVIVRAFKDASEETRYVAFFVPDHEHFVTLAEVRRFARQHLAAELTPQQLVELDEFPSGAAGVDRKALRDPLAPEDNFSAPRTTTEKALARIWQEALGVERVGLGDNFFDLGGHSLLSTRVVMQIYKKLGVRLDQATMVLNTLEQISRDVDQRVSVTQTAAANEAEAAPAPQRDKGLLRSLFGKKAG
ncbi:MAG: beta-ketoacyl synthase N-terminal-like domain-containing protein [Steroidobacteraceae bacterium]